MTAADMMMEVENEFGMTIPFEDWPAIVTAGDLLNQVLPRARRLQAEIPREATLGTDPGATFLWLRRTLREVLEDPALRLRPSDALEAKIPQDRRILIWQQWRVASLLPLPLLERTRSWDVWLQNSALLVGFGSFFAALGLALSGGPDWLGDQAGVAFLLLFPGGILVAMILLYVRDCLPGSCVPPEIETFGDLVHWQLPQLKAMATARDQSLETDEVWLRLRRIIHNVLNVPEDEIHLHSRFMEDLGCE